METELEAKNKAEGKVVPALKKLVNGVAKFAQAAVKGMAAVLGLGIAIFLCVMAYFYFSLDARWWLLLPGLLMGLPLLGAGAFWYMLYCVAHLPNTLKDAITGTAKIKPRHIQRAEKLQDKKGLKAAMARLHLTGSLLWDVAWNASDHGDTVGDAQMAMWLFNPFFWVIMMWCMFAVLVSQIAFTIFCFLHWLF